MKANDLQKKAEIAAIANYSTVVEREFAQAVVVLLPVLEAAEDEGHEYGSGNICPICKAVAAARERIVP